MDTKHTFASVMARNFDVPPQKATLSIACEDALDATPIADTKWPKTLTLEALITPCWVESKAAVQLLAHKPLKPKRLYEPHKAVAHIDVIFQEKGYASFEHETLPLDALPHTVHAKTPLFRHTFAHIKQTTKEKSEANIYTIYPFGGRFTCHDLAACHQMFFALHEKGAQTDINLYEDIALLEMHETQAQLVYATPKDALDLKSLNQHVESGSITIALENIEGTQHAYRSKSATQIKDSLFEITLVKT